LTTPVKEDDRVRQIEAINAQTGPVMIGYPNCRRSTQCGHSGRGKLTSIAVDDGAPSARVIADDALIDRLTSA
jgi:hypothetical protein